MVTDPVPKLPFAFVFVSASATATVGAWVLRKPLVSAFAGKRICRAIGPPGWPHQFERASTITELSRSKRFVPMLPQRSLLRSEPPTVLVNTPSTFPWLLLQSIDTTELFALTAKLPAVVAPKRVKRRR